MGSDAATAVAIGIQVATAFQTEEDSASAVHAETALLAGRPVAPQCARRNKPVRLNDVLEEEAKRMAQSLHDEAGQLLAAVYLKLDEVTGTLPDGQGCRVSELRSMLGDLEGELRRLSHELRPMILEDLGLMPAIEFLRQGVAKRTGLQIELRGSTAGRVPANVETALYRIVHEALGQIVNHPAARRVTIAFLRDAEEIECSIRVEGVGGLLSAERGMVAIRDRVEDLSGRFWIRSGSSLATELHVSIPLDC